MTPLTFLCRELGSNTARMFLSGAQNKLSYSKRTIFLLPKIISHFGTKLKPVLRVAYVFTFAQVTKDKILEIPPPEKLTHEYMIAQASNSTITSSQQLLTLTVAAITDIAERYRECMNYLISLMEHTLELSSSDQPEKDLWEEVVAMRIKVEELKQKLLDLSGFMEYVDKVATGSAEVSYFMGAEHITSSMCDMINTAHEKIKEEYEKTQIIERELLKSQEHFIRKACEIEKLLKKRECEIKKASKEQDGEHLPKEGECHA